jgi:FMN-dependent NADH-azoreductase
MKVLHIDASILGKDSVSRQVSAAIVENLCRANPGIEVTYRDLDAEPLAHFSAVDLAFADPALDEFLGADVVVIGAPMYNFGIPSQLKAWIDRIVAAGKTFRYDEQGAKGLAGKKRVIVAVSRGGLLWSAVSFRCRRARRDVSPHCARLHRHCRP